MLAKFLIIPFFTFSFVALSADFPWAVIKSTKGKVTYKGKLVNVGATISSEGFLETKDKSFVKVELGEQKSTIVLGPNGSMQLKRGKDYKTQKIGYIYTLRKGLCRWITGDGKNKKVPKLHTEQAIMGVRGTDYLVEVNPLLGETELIVLDGAVMFENAKSSSDKKLIKKGQWGGIGGRFGQEIGTILDLPENVIREFSKKLN